MAEEENNHTEEIEETEEQESSAQQSAPTTEKRRFFSRRNAVIAIGVTLITAILFVVLVTVSFRYGVVDNYVKGQFVAKMQDIGVDFDADVFRLTLNPFKLELRNATFNDRITGDKLFFIRAADIFLTVNNLYAWQLSRDIEVQTTNIEGLEAWVTFDENGKSNFSNLEFIQDEAGSRVNFKYDSLNFSLKDGLIHFGDVQHKLAGDAKNIMLFIEPTNPATPDEQKQYKIDFTSTASNFVYDESKIEPIDIRAQGIADDTGAQITELKISTPLGSSILSGKITDWERLKYDLKIDSTVDLTQTSTILPLGTPLRGIGNFNGTVTGEGSDYKVVGEITSDALTASNIYLKALNANATITGSGSMYEANGKVIAELLTFEDFKIDFPQISGNIRGTGTDFKWFGDLQAVAVKSPLGSIGGIYITDAAAEYNNSVLNATLGNVRANTLFSDQADITNLRASNVKITANGDNIDVNAPGINAGNVKTDSATLRGVTANNIKVKKRGDNTNAQIGSARVENLETEDARLRNLRAGNVSINANGNRTNIKANQVQADGVNANGATVGNLNASGVDVNIVGDETTVYSNNLQVAKVETDAATLGSLNIAGVRLTIRQGRIEAESDNINAGDIALNKSGSLPDGGKINNVKLAAPVFVLEPSGRYRATADLSLGGGVLGSIQLGAARAKVDLNNDQVALNNLSADVMDGKVNGDATIAFNNSRRSNINVDFNNLDLGKLLALQGGKVVPLEGETTGQVNLSFAGTNFKTASGSLTADITANAGTAEKGTIPVVGRVEATAANGLFNLDYAKLNTAETEVNAQGQFDLNGNNSNLNLAVNSSDASEIQRIITVLDLSPGLEGQLNDYGVEIAGNLNFTGNIRGNINDPTIDGRASLETLSLRGQEIGSVRTDIFVSPAGVELKDGLLQENDGVGTLAFDVSIPSGGSSNTSINATLDKINTGKLLAVLPLQNSQFEQFKDFQARTSGTINISGIPDNLQGSANISSGSGTLNGEPFDGFEAQANFAGNLVTLEKFEAKFGDGVLRASGTYQTDTTGFDFDVTGNNIDLTRVRPFIPNSKDLPKIKGTLDLTAKATGTGSLPGTYDINFSGTGKNILVEDRAFGAITFNGKTENQQFSANVTADFGGQQQTIAANVNLADPNLPFTAQTVFDNTNLAPYIALVRDPGEEPEITGNATGRVFIEGNLTKLNAKGEREFSTENLSGAAQFNALGLQIGDTPIAASEPVSVRFNTQEVVIESAKFSGGGTNLVVSGTKALTENGVNNLTADGTVNLRLLDALATDVFFSGLANVNVRLSGPNSTAKLVGSADVNNASVSAFVGTERLTLQRVKGRILFTSNQAQIDELSGFLGGGRVTASGGILLSDNLQPSAFRFDLRGNNITAPLPPDFITTGDADIQISGRRIAGVLNTYVSGEFNAKRSIYAEDIDLADLVGVRRQTSLGSGSSDSSGGLGVIKLDIRVAGNDALVIRNNLADLTASLDLRITGDVDFPQVSGRITANRGTLFFRDDRYEVLRGELVFPPNTSIEPIINLQAETEINGYQILINLNGSLSDTENLQATVRSNPSLPETDVISLITTGNVANAGGGIPTLAQGGINTAADILTDEIINKPLSKATDKLFGLNKFELDPLVAGQRGGSPTARLTVGRQINKNLLVTYSTNLSADQNQVLALEYRVSNKLSFVAQYEQRPLGNVTQRRSNFSVEIRLRKRF